MPKPSMPRTRQRKFADGRIRQEHFEIVTSESMSLAKVKRLGVTTPQGYAGTLVHEFTLTNSVRRFPPSRFSDVESRDLVRLTTEDSNRPFAGSRYVRKQTSS
jgi:hypothetical protein